VHDLIGEGFVGEVLAVTMAMISPGVPERARSRMWERTRAGGVSALTIRAMHSLEALCLCVGELTEISARIATRIPQWKVSGTDEMVDVEVPDTVMVHGVAASGALVSAHIATVPTATPGFRMEIYGREGTLVATGTVSSQRGETLRLQGARGNHELRDLAVPERFVYVPTDFPRGDPFNVGQMYALFAAAIRTGQNCLPTFDTAVDLHRFIDTLKQASETGRELPVT